MPAKPSGEIKTSVIRKPQKNGDIYIVNSPMPHAGAGCRKFNFTADNYFMANRYKAAAVERVK